MSAPPRDVHSSGSAASVAEAKPTFSLLIVDDSPLDRELYSALLSRHATCEIRTAADGEEALVQIEAALPDIILTDLRMPRMDGLALVREVKERTPQIPVILVTAHGSEEIAAEALQVGAAHYVPKSNFAEFGWDTVEKLLGIAWEQQQRRRLRECWGHSEYSFQLTNDDDLIHPLVLRLQESLRELFGATGVDVIRVGVALHEAIKNAMHHGNLELDSQLRAGDASEYFQLGLQRRNLQPYADRRVHIHVWESPREVQYRIRDEGPGFDVSGFDYDPTDSANLLKPSGRGLYLIRTFMHDVQFNSQGNEITMTYRPSED